MHRFTGWSPHVFNSRYQRRVSPSLNRWVQPRRKAFTSHRGLYQFVRIPLGLKNIPNPFQLSMDVILLSVNLQSALVNLDDIVRFSKTVQQLLTYLRRVLKIFLNAAVTHKLKLSSLFAEASKYLGHVILSVGLKLQKRRRLRFKSWSIRQHRQKTDLSRAFATSFDSLWRNFRILWHLEAENYGRNSQSSSRNLERKCESL